MSVNVIGILIGMLLLFGLTVCIIGNICFVNAFKNEYATVTYHMADSAAVFVSGDHIEDYLADDGTELNNGEYIKTKQQK